MQQLLCSRQDWCQPWWGQKESLKWFQGLGIKPKAKLLIKSQEQDIDLGRALGEKKWIFLHFCWFYQVLSECSSGWIICKILCHCSISAAPITGSHNGFLTQNMSRVWEGLVSGLTEWKMFFIGATDGSQHRGGIWRKKSEPLCLFNFIRFSKALSKIVDEMRGEMGNYWFSYSLICFHLLFSLTESIKCISHFKKYDCRVKKKKIKPFVVFFFIHTRSWYLKI